ncbi:MAG TPA: hypothetical protein GX707_09085 [Epulopiscium sp.]|nr:hypothetical protein [Candidatus Epulonipiscium sp.]
MLNFDEEVKKFKPSLEVENIQKNIKNDTMGDLLDVIKQMASVENTRAKKMTEKTETQEKNKDKE